MFNLRTSRFLQLSFKGLISIALLFLLLLPIAWFLKILSTVILLSTAYFIYKQKLLTLEFSKLKKLDQKRWLLESEEGNCFEGDLRGDSVVSTFFSIIILRSSAQKNCWRTCSTKNVMVTKDMLPKKQYHRLCLELKGQLH